MADNIKQIGEKICCLQEKVAEIERESAALSDELKALQKKLEEQELSMAQEGRILRNFTERDVIGRRKDGSRIFGKPRRLKEARRRKK
ncbi:MAG: hypothetical protein QME12_00145 [Nanoarchaeota archaeon]|nr:hypothetical protein [Nanoarchaeota archaeon]